MKSHGADSSSAYSSSHDPEKNAGHSGFAADDHEHVDDHHVDVNKAKEQFHALERRMSERSSLHRARTRQSAATSDVENQDDDDEWNLMDYMKGNHEIREREGFRHKEIGVVWNGLTVVGGGGMSELRVSSRGVFTDHALINITLPILFSARSCRNPHPNLPQRHHGAIRHARHVRPQALRYRPLFA